MSDLGKAYVQIIPKAEGISGEIEEILSPEAESAGKAAGSSIVSSMGSSLSKAGGALTAGLTAPLTAVGAASMKAFTNVDSGMDTIIQKTGASGEVAEEMQGIMERLATQIPTDFATAGAAIGEVNTRFGATGQELEDLSAQFIKFADLNGTDVSGSIDAVQSAMAAFGLGTQDTGAFLDTLNKAGQDTGVSMDKLAGDLVTNAATLQSMGYNASDAANFIANLNKNGIDSSTVMTGMKRAFASATQDGKTMSEAMTELQTSMQNAETDTAAYQAALDLFGTKAGPALAKAVQDGRLSFDQLGTSINDNLGNVDQTFSGTRDDIDNFKTTLNSLQIVGAQIGGQLATSLTPILAKFSEGLQWVSDKWNTLSPQTQDAIVKVGLVIAAIGPLIAIIGGVISAVSTVGAVIGVLTSPIALIVAAIAAVIAIIVVCVTHWDEIKEKMIEVANSVKAKVVAAWEGLKSKVASVFDNVKSKVQTTWDNIKSKTKSTWDNVKSNVSSSAGNIKSKIADAWSTVKSKTKSAWDKVKESIMKPINDAKATVKSVIDKIKGFFPLSIGNIFSNFHLPHLNVSGGTPPYGIGGMGSLPHFSVDWYAKGGVFDAASVIGVGEAGREAVVPLSGTYMRPFAEAIASEMSGSGGTTNYFNITVDGAENPEDYARRLARELQLVMRTA